MNENSRRRCCLLSGIGLTLFGCVICALSIALPGWQIIELSELNAVHEHGIFYDCVRSETVPLDKNRPRDFIFRTSKRCTYKFDSTATRSIRVAVEDGDASAAEVLLHRFLPQHKAVIFFFIFTVIFAMMSMVVGACSPCFVPNGVLHVFSVLTATACSMFADGIFFVGSMKTENRNIPGVINYYQQSLGYAFFVHFFGTLTLLAATFCSMFSAYLLIRKEWRMHGCCNSKSISKHTYNYDSYSNYPSFISSTPNAFYGFGEEMQGRLLDVPGGTLRMPMEAPMQPPPSLFAVPTRVHVNLEPRGAHGMEQFERLTHEEDV